jgi:vancomycin permeability regulator SanA
LLGAELASWLASRDAARAGGGSCGVLVLGYPTREDGEPHPVQRQRVAAAVLAYREHGCERIVLSGGAVHNGHVEADAMARIARELGVPADVLVLERAARSTFENVALGAPQLAGYDTIYIASEPLHARRARRYLCRQSTALCRRAALAPAYRPFAGILWKLGSALYELRAWLRDLAAPAP